MRWKSITNPPRTKYNSLIDVGKFNLIWNVSLILVPIFTFLLLMHIIFKDVSWTTSALALGVGISNLYILRTTRKYEIVGWLSVILGVAICQAAIFLVDDSRLVADLMWCILIAFFTFFLFGNLAGLFVLLLNLSGLLTYQFVATPEQLASKGITADMVDYKMAINVYYVAFALAFVISRMQKNNEAINERFEEQIKHNELLIKEVHHRVKNNLQIMASLLRLQAAESNNELVINNLESAVGRINSMAFIHEKMYQKNAFISLYCEEFLAALAESILQTDDSNGIAFRIESDKIILAPDAVVTISLLINELMTNSIKHAFDGKRGEISISVEEDEHDILINYRDNGTWKDPKDSSGFGRDLIATLTEHIEGEHECLISAEGTCYVFKFPRYSIVQHN